MPSATPDTSRTYVPDKAEGDAISLASKEEVNWRHGDIFVTDEIYYQMRTEVKRNRKNYYGKFVQEKDKATDLDKIWVPLTEWSVETMVKNIDIDTKDILIKASCPEKIGTANVLKMITNNYLKNINFGETLNDIQRRTVIDGTCIVKATKSWSPEFKRNMVNVRVVDFLNFYIDPAARSIQEAPAVIEKSVMTTQEFYKYGDKWDNMDFATPTTRFRTFQDHAATGFTREEVPLIEVYERWGKIRKSWITNNEEDKNTWIEGIVIISNLRENPVVHKIIENKKGLRPYEECWMRRVPSRWAGRGIPEMLKGLQLYANSTVNIRRNTGLVVQTGTFKIRKGAGITEQNLSSLKAGGAVPVDNMEDIQELRTGDIKPSSYEDENNIYDLAEKVSGVKELPTSPTTEPTTAVIQKEDVGSAADMVKENVAFFLRRLFERHIIPLLVESLKDRETMRLSCGPDELKNFDDAIINYFVNQAIIEFYKKTGTYPTQQQVDTEKNKAREKFKKMGTDRFVEIWKDNFNEKFDVEVVVTGEAFDKAVVVKQLNDLLFAYAKLPGANIDVNSVMQQIFDILGLPSNQLISSKPQQPQLAPGEELPNPQQRTAVDLAQAGNPLAR